MIFPKNTSTTHTGILTRIRGSSDTNCIHLEFNLRSGEKPAEATNAILKEKITQILDAVNPAEKKEIIQRLFELLFPSEQPSLYFETWINAPKRKYEDILNNLPHEDVTITKEGSKNLCIMFKSGITINIKNPDSRTPKTTISTPTELTP